MRLIISSIVLSFFAITVPASAADVSSDLVVYGGTAGGVAAAIAAAREGRTVTLIEPQARVGGMVSGGLCKTDFGDRSTIGGIPAEFFGRSLKYYQDTYGPDSKETKASHAGLFLEPKIAEKLFNDLLAETNKVKVLTGHRLAAAHVIKGHVTSITIEEIKTGKLSEIEGAEFIDASYEGDLMAGAGVPYRVGRESRSEFSESLAGITAGPPQFIGMGDQRTQAYNIRGTITDRPDLRVPFPKPEHYDRAAYDSIVQAINKRKIKRLEDLLTFLRGEAQLACGKYDPNVQDLAGTNYSYPDGSWAERQRVYEGIRDFWVGYFYTLQSDPAVSEDFRKDMANWGLPRDEYPENGNITPQLYVREARRMLGVYVLNENDVRMNRYKPDSICMGSYTIDCHTVQWMQNGDKRESEGNLGTGTEAYEVPYRCLVPPNVDNLLVVCTLSTTHVAYATLRMEPVYMMLGQAAGLASSIALETKSPVQSIDTKTLQADLKKAGVPLAAPYRPIVKITMSPRVATPGQPVKFSLVDVDVRKPLKTYEWNFDGSGKAQSTDREPTFTFSDAKNYVASLRVTDEDGKRSYTTLCKVDAGDSSVPDVEVTYKDAKLAGAWRTVHAGDDFDFRLYSLSDSKHGGEIAGEETTASTKTIRFTPELPRAGRYLVCVAFPAAPTRADNVPVHVNHADGTATITLNEQTADTPFIFKPLGEYKFKAGHDGSVVVSAEGTKGVVAVGAVKWIWVGE